MVFLHLAVAHPAGQTEKKVLSLDEGRELVYALLRPTGCTERSCRVNAMENSYFPRLYFFYASWPNPTGSPHIGSYAVDPATGDVWDADACTEYRGGPLAIQTRLQRELGLTKRAHAALKQRPPMCESSRRVRVSKVKK